MEPQAANPRGSNRAEVEWAAASFGTWLISAPLAKDFRRAMLGEPAVIRGNGQRDNLADRRLNILTGQGVEESTGASPP